MRDTAQQPITGGIYVIRFMIDTDRLDKLTGHAELLATYTDLVTNLPALHLKYPHSEVILIDRGLGDPTGEASVFDIEPGALTPEEAVDHYDNARSRGIRYLTAYHDRADFDAVKRAFGSRPLFHWFATLDGMAHVFPYVPLFGPAAIQCLTASDLDYHADGSLVFEDSWHPTKVPFPTATFASYLGTVNAGLAEVARTLHEMALAIGG